MRLPPPADKSHWPTTIWFVPMSHADKFRAAAILERLAGDNAAVFGDEYAAGLHQCSARYLWGLYEVTR